MLTSLKNNSQRTAKNHKASMNMKLKNLQHSLSVAAMFAVALIPPTGAQAQDFQWLGSSGANSNNPATSSNWSGQPTFNTANTGGLWSQTGSSTMNYSSAQGTTVFSGGSFNGLSWLGYAGGSGVGGTAGQSTIQVTGGTLNLNGNFANDSGTESVWVGNAAGVSMSVQINGGAVSVANGMVIACGMGRPPQAFNASRMNFLRWVFTCGSSFRRVARSRRTARR